MNMSHYYYCIYIL